MPVNLGMIALGKAKVLEKRLIKLEELVKDIEKQVRDTHLSATQSSQSIV